MQVYCSKSLKNDRFFALDSTAGPDKKGLIEMVNDSETEKSICYLPYKEPFISRIKSCSEEIPLHSYLAVRGYVLTILQQQLQADPSIKKTFSDDGPPAGPA